MKPSQSTTTRTPRVRKVTMAIGKPEQVRREMSDARTTPMNDVRSTPVNDVLPTPDGQTLVSNDALRAMVAQSAYLRAEKRGFEPGREVEDWLEADAEILLMLGGQSRALALTYQGELARQRGRNPFRRAGSDEPALRLGTGGSGERMPPVEFGGL